MKLLTTILSIMLLNPILGDTWDSTHDGDPKNYYENIIYAEDFKEGQKDNIRISFYLKKFDSSAEHVILCNKDAKMAITHMADKIHIDSVYHQSNDVSEFFQCQSLRHIIWDLHLISYEAGVHKVDLFFTFKFCSLKRRVCTHETIDITTYIKVKK